MADINYNQNSFTAKTEKEFSVHGLKNKSGLKAWFLPGRGLIDIFYEDIMLNLYSGSEMDSGPADIYLRILDGPEIKFTSLIKNGLTHVGDEFFSVTGEFLNIQYRVDCFLADKENNWFWQVSLSTEGENRQIELVYFQDVGLGVRGNIKNSEYYNSQYIDHEIIELESYGKIICSRQNLAQNKQNPFLVSACFQGAKGGFTDGMQFYGLSYKETLIPEALKRKEWPSLKKQHEFSAHVLQSETIELKAGKLEEIIFFNSFQADNKKTCLEADLVFPPIPEFKPGKGEARSNNRSLFSKTKYFPVRELEDGEINGFFGKEKKHEEREDGKLLAFFTSDSHVVLKSKELLCERPHGHIIRNCSSIFPNEKITSATLWMNGVFNSHLTFGNTSFGKHLGVVRSAYSILRSSGVRIFVKDGDDFSILGIPSAFQISLSYCTWLYRGPTRTIQVRTWSEGTGNSVLTDITIIEGDDAEFIISVNPVMGALENNVAWHVAIADETARISAEEMDDDLVLAIHDGKCRIKGDEALFVDRKRRFNPFIVIVTEKIRRLSFSLGREFPRQTSFNAAIEEAESFWSDLLQGRRLAKQGQKFNTVLPWFLHNAMIHFATPYGLEQTSGAAWGVRDVCQGPIELFSCLGKNDINQQILRNIFSHQYIETGNWPQWYMFDKYYKTQHHESHGDIIIWPLKALCDYLENTEDFDFLKEEISYSDHEYEFTEVRESINHHIERLLAAIRESFICGTFLVHYGGGDWNDSLQPLDEKVAASMVSSWTVALLYQTLKRYLKILERTQQDTGGVEEMVEGIRKDFNKFLVRNRITAGFCQFQGGHIDPILHPDDQISGVKYRLLPTIRGIISELFSPEQAEEHYQMIQEHLLLPDGAHLTDVPVEYRGGKCRNFQRAETASFFGREIGTNYIHAQLRYCEAMAKLGKAEDFCHGLQVANPVDIRLTVANALRRQSNCYFSSSDADFPDRYKARDAFEEFRQGKIGAAGGWRIYSSGPGIFINLLLTRFLGIRKYFDKIILDPVLPVSYDGLEYQTQIDNYSIKLTYRVKKADASIQNILINGQPMPDFGREFNPYRLGGLYMPIQELGKLFERTENHMVLVIN